MIGPSCSWRSSAACSTAHRCPCHVPTPGFRRRRSDSGGRPRTICQPCRWHGSPRCHQKRPRCAGKFAAAEAAPLCGAKLRQPPGERALLAAGRRRRHPRRRVVVGRPEPIQVHEGRHSDACTMSCGLIRRPASPQPRLCESWTSRTIALPRRGRASERRRGATGRAVLLS
jgi:hypothetical protein